MPPAAGSLPIAMSPFLPAVGAAALAAAILAWALIALSRSWLARMALARPEARSSHRVPTPQGAGLSVVASVVTVAGAAAWGLGLLDRSLVSLAAGLVGLAALGFADDVNPLAWRAKLAAQGLCCILVAWHLPAPPVPDPGPGLAWMAFGFAVLALLALVNLVNFIDGIDEITAAHAAPACAMAALAGLAGLGSPGMGLAAAAGLGALAGFWLWNRHPARIFLGDSGSLPLGLLLGWLALILAFGGHWTSAALMVLYPVLDGGVTLLRRLARGAPLTRPHRDHAYQRAVDTGVPVRRVAATVAIVAAGAAVLGFVGLVSPHPAVDIALVAVGMAWALAPIASWLRRRPVPEPASPSRSSPSRSSP